MADISVQNLTKYFGDKLILQDISFDVQPGEKVAILGANGAGKTTLLNILTGRLPYDGGHVSFGQGKTAGVIDQMPDFPPDATVEDVLRLAFRESDEVAAAMDALTDEMTRRPDDASLLKRYAQLETRLEILGGYNRDYEIDRVCNGLEIPQDMRAQRFALLSGGEMTRINLARIILEQTDILLLDEPTNHLDMQAVDWLGEYLEAYRGTVLIISTAGSSTSAATASSRSTTAPAIFTAATIPTTRSSASAAARDSSSTTSTSWPKRSASRRLPAPCTSTAPSTSPSARPRLRSASRA